MESRIDARFAEIDERFAGIDGRFAEMESRNNERYDMLRAEMHHMHDDFVERINDKETKLLQAFCSYTASNQKRLAGVETEEASLKSRLSSLEDRVIELEKRLNMPPAA
jgi:hypothetical protein